MRFSRRPVQLLLCGLCFVLSACAYRPLESMNVAMDIVYDAACTQRADTLIVMLPGAYDAPQDFIAQGFVQVLRDRHLNVDVALVNAHIGYYTHQQIVERLEREVIQPARAKGYASVWLVGISLGGYGSLLYSMRHSQHIDGIFIMAPFMGSRHLPAEIAKAGGLKSWVPEPLSKLDIDDELWRWLKQYAHTAQPTPPIYLGFGLDDRFTASNRLLADVLPSEQVMTVPGGHTWAPWLALWGQFLDRAPWAKPALCR